MTGYRLLIYVNCYYETCLPRSLRVVNYFHVRARFERSGRSLFWAWYVFRRRVGTRAFIVLLIYQEQ